MSETTVRHVTAKIPIQMPASTQADGDPGYTVGDALEVLREQRDRQFRAVDRAFIHWARGL